MTDSCTPATCPNGKCNQTGECIEQTAEEMRRLGETFPRIASPPLVPNADPRPSDCPQRMRAEGKPYPRSCRRCGIRRCQYEMIAPAPASAPVGRTIVAFTGLAGSGKSTAAAHLITRHGFQRVRFAGPLKAMMAALGLTPEQIDGSEKETPCELLGGKTPRHAMQTLGTEWGRDLIASDLWIRAWQAAIAKVPAGVPVVVDDCRFPNEAETVRAAGGVIVRIDRPGAGTASVHSSEQHQIKAVETLRNIADERYLLDQVDILVMDLSWRDTPAPPPNQSVLRSGSPIAAPLP